MTAKQTVRDEKKKPRHLRVPRFLLFREESVKYGLRLQRGILIEDIAEFVDGTHFDLSTRSLLMPSVFPSSCNVCRSP